MADPDGSASAAEETESGPATPDPTTAVRYGKMSQVGEFAYSPDVKFDWRARLVISTERGIEIGEQLSPACFGCAGAVAPEQMRAYAEASGGDTYRLNAGRILREATEGDLAELRHIADSTVDRLGTARQLVDELSLEMRIVDCEQILGGERIVFYFMAEQRVDFRQLVRSLASEFQTRIEMRQVGARDEARLLADYETCGRECCCRNFLKTLKPVNMAMAKLQKTTLDLAKVSGRCGRLKCCLRYEHESYESLDKNLPKTGTWISTVHGIGRIVDRQILTQLVKIHTQDGRLMAVAIDDILETDLPPPPAPAADDAAAERRGASSTRRPPARKASPPASSGKTEPGCPEVPGAPSGEEPPPVEDPPAPPVLGKTPPTPAPSANDVAGQPDRAVERAETSHRKRRRRGKRRRGGGGAARSDPNQPAAEPPASA